MSCGVPLRTALWFVAYKSSSFGCQTKFALNAVMKCQPVIVTCFKPKFIISFIYSLDTVSQSLRFAWGVSEAKCILVTHVCVSVPRRIPTLLLGPGCNLGNGRGCPHYWARICNRCTGFVALTTQHRTRIVSECLYSLYAWFIFILQYTSYPSLHDLDMTLKRSSLFVRNARSPPVVRYIVRLSDSVKDLDGCVKMFYLQDCRRANAGIFRSPRPRFGFFRPRCTDGVKVGAEESAVGQLLHAKFLRRFRGGGMGSKTVHFTKFRFGM